MPDTFIHSSKLLQNILIMTQTLVKKTKPHTQKSQTNPPNPQTNQPTNSKTKQDKKTQKNPKTHTQKTPKTNQIRKAYKAPEICFFKKSQTYESLLVFSDEKLLHQKHYSSHINPAFLYCVFLYISQPH